MPPPPLPLTTAAETLGVSVKTVRRLVAKGRLASTRYTEGGKIYIEVDELERFRAACKAPSKIKTGRRQFAPKPTWGRME